MIVDFHSNELHSISDGIIQLKMKEYNSVCVFYRVENYSPEDSVGHLMRQILHGMAQQVECQLVHTELTNAQWIPMFKLYSGQASTVAELARQCNLDAGAMTRTLDRLEAKGLCKRVRSKTDRRVVNIEITPAGIHAAADIAPILCGVQNAHLAGFSDQEFKVFREYLRRILINVNSVTALSV
jgi:DNA-binding MarR family transcriptional regulator